MAEGQTVGRALHGHEGHRKEGILVERSKYLQPAYIEIMGIARLFFIETRCHLSKLGHQVVSFFSSTCCHFLEEFSRMRVWLGDTRVDDFVQITPPRMGSKAISEP